MVIYRGGGWFIVNIGSEDKTLEDGSSSSHSDAERESPSYLESLLKNSWFSVFALNSHWSTSSQGIKSQTKWNQNTKCFEALASETTHHFPFLIECHLANASLDVSNKYVQCGFLKKKKKGNETLFCPPLLLTFLKAKDFPGPYSIAELQHLWVLR